METFGERMKRLRQERGLTVQFVAERLHVTHSVIGRAESGEQMIRAWRLEPLARVLDVSIDYLLTGRHPSTTAAFHRAIRAQTPHATLLAMVERQERGR